MEGDAQWRRLYSASAWPADCLSILLTLPSPSLLSLFTPSRPPLMQRLFFFLRTPDDIATMFFFALPPDHDSTAFFVVIALCRISLLLSVLARGSRDTPSLFTLDNPPMTTRRTADIATTLDHETYTAPDSISLAARPDDMVTDTRCTLSFSTRDGLCLVHSRGGVLERFKGRDAPLAPTPHSTSFFTIHRVHNSLTPGWAWRHGCLGSRGLLRCVLLEVAGIVVMGGGEEDWCWERGGSRGGGVCH
jgi:hypothetical protein